MADEAFVQDPVYSLPVIGRALMQALDAASLAGRETFECRGLRSFRHLGSPKSGPKGGFFLTI
jgi:hypothetical protein